MGPHDDAEPPAGFLAQHWRPLLHHTGGEGGAAGQRRLEVTRRPAGAVAGGGARASTSAHCCRPHVSRWPPQARERQRMPLKCRSCSLWSPQAQCYALEGCWQWREDCPGSRPPEKIHSVQAAAAVDNEQSRLNAACNACKSQCGGVYRHACALGHRQVLQRCPGDSGGREAPVRPHEWSHNYKLLAATETCISCHKEWQQQRQRMSRHGGAAERSGRPQRWLQPSPLLPGAVLLLVTQCPRSCCT